MAVTTTSTLSGALRTYYERYLLKRLMPYLIHCRDAQPGRIKRGQGKVCNFRKYGTLALVTSPLTEGTPPAGKSLSVSSITATVDQYGDFVTLSDVASTQLVDPIILEALDVLAEQVGGSVDVNTRDIINAGTNVRYANGAANRAALAATDKVTVLEIKKSRRALERANVRPFPDGYYHSKIHTDAAFDLTEDSRWTSAKQWASPEDLKTGALGEIEGVRFWKSPQAKVFAGAGAGGVDVFSTLIYGPNAFGTLSYEAEEPGGINPEEAAAAEYQLPVSIHIKELGSSGIADPLDQVMSLGWKVAWVAKILDEARIQRIESGATA